MIGELYYQGVERVISMALAMDLDHHEHIASLEGSCVDIVLTDSPGSMRLSFVDHSILVSEIPKDGGSANVEIHGRAYDLLQFGVLQKNTHNTSSNPVYFKGDVRLGREIQRFFSKLDLDWEEQLSNYIGDVPAHFFGRMVIGLNNIKKSIRESMRDNVQQYITNETNHFVLNDELELFSIQVAGLRDDIDRFKFKCDRFLEKGDSLSCD